MNRKKRMLYTIGVVWALVLGISMYYSSAAMACKVLVVMGYHEEFRLSQELKAGIDQELAETCDVQYHYLDVLRHPESAEAKAKEAFEIYQRVQPDGVIAANDDAQTRFVVPYMKDKVITPVVFCEVIDQPEKYGYPASNVTGVLIRPFFKQSIEFLAQIAPSIQSVGLIGPQLPLVEAAYRQITEQREQFQVAILEPVLGKTFEETLEQAKVLRNQSDAVFLAPLYDQQQTQQLLYAFGKATVTTKRELIEYGVLCGVIENTREEGQLAANMLVKAIQGTPISKIPITTNEYGRRVMNVSTLHALGIKPRHEVLVGTELIKTVE